VFRVSQYKFFGPHLGALYGRYELLDQLRAYKVRPADDVPPHKFETGTKNHEGLGRTTASINYLADLASEFGTPFADQYPGFEGRRLHYARWLSGWGRRASLSGMAIITPWRLPSGWGWRRAGVWCGWGLPIQHSGRGGSVVSCG
jgi:hypothetical protein